MPHSKASQQSEPAERASRASQQIEPAERASRASQQKFQQSEPGIDTRLCACLHLHICARHALSRLTSAALSLRTCRHCLRATLGSSLVNVGFTALALLGLATLPSTASIKTSLAGGCSSSLLARTPGMAPAAVHSDLALGRCTRSSLSLRLADFFIFCF